MPAFFTIELKELCFFADHGLYEQELKTGNEFEVEVSMECEAPEEIVHSIDQTLNYAEAYQVVKSVFNQRTDLLETIAMLIAKQLKDRFHEILKISVRISKLHPPVVGFRGRVSVLYTQTFR